MLSFVTFRCIAGASLSLLLITYSTCPPISESPNPSTHTNALIHESSPYLVQHAHNPVDWRPWSEEAWEKHRLHPCKSPHKG
ncbi:MAG TPA: hypothetical protein DCX14_13150 [Flavobacteriales bacterium]|nr:hypothetical protein [Flavobacteriales bacterium]